MQDGHGPLFVRQLRPLRIQAHSRILPAPAQPPATPHGIRTKPRGRTCWARACKRSRTPPSCPRPTPTAALASSPWRRRPSPRREGRVAGERRGRRRSSPGEEEQHRPAAAGAGPGGGVRSPRPPSRTGSALRPRRPRRGRTGYLHLLSFLLLFPSAAGSRHFEPCSSPVCQRSRQSAGLLELLWLLNASDPLGLHQTLSSDLSSYQSSAQGSSSTKFSYLLLFLHFMEFFKSVVTVADEMFILLMKLLLADVPMKAASKGRSSRRFEPVLLPARVSSSDPPGRRRRQEVAGLSGSSGLRRDPGAGPAHPVQRPRPRRRRRTHQQPGHAHQVPRVLVRSGPTAPLCARVSRLFDGTEPIVLDWLKQHYFAEHRPRRSHVPLRPELPEDLQTVHPRQLHGK